MFKGVTFFFVVTFGAGKPLVEAFADSASLFLADVLVVFVLVVAFLLAATFLAAGSEAAVLLFDSFDVFVFIYNVR